MPLETATYINQLDSSNPASTDQLAQADEHLRLLKSVLKSTFPNLTGPVTATQATLNSIETIVPIGVITAWYGSSASVPLGWAICNGQTVARSDGLGNITTPNLVDKVIVGAGSSVAAQGVSVGSTSSAVNTGVAGSHNHTVSGGSHTHGGSVLGHSLTEDQMPPHFHRLVANVIRNVDLPLEPDGSLAWANRDSGNEEIELASAGTTDPTLGRSSLVGSGNAHSHGLSIQTNSHSHDVSTGGEHTHSVSVSTVQPSMGLHYIMKI